MPKAEPTHVLVKLANGALKSFPVGHPATTAEGVEVVKDRPATDQHELPVRTKYPVAKKAAAPKPEEAK
jgi:hypothetical protein